MFYDSHAKKARIYYGGADPRGKGAHAQYASLLDALLRADEGSDLAGRTQAERQSLDVFAREEGWLIEERRTFILEGLVQEQQKLQFLVSQPFIAGVEASDAEIEVYFIERGFERCAKDSFSVMMGGRLWTVADARPANDPA